MKITKHSITNTKLFFLIVIFFLTGCAGNETLNDENIISERLVSGIFLEEPAKGGLPQGVKRRTINNQGLEVTKFHEGWIPKRYNDPAGYCTIGYGHLLKKNPCDNNAPAEFSKCDISAPGEFLNPISKTRGEQVLRCDMANAEIAVMQLARDSLTDGQYAALVDFTFNVGSRNFERSQLRRVVNNGDYQRVPVELRKWVKAGGKVYKGLQNRREKEIKLFFDGASRGGKPAVEELIDIRTGE